MIRDKNLFGGSSSGLQSRNGAHNYSSVPIGEHDNDEEDTNHNGNMKLSHKQRIKEQDSNLDMLGESVQRLGSISLTISNEIKMQNLMLDDLEQNVDGAQDKAETLLQVATCLCLCLRLCL